MITQTVLDAVGDNFFEILIFGVFLVATRFCFVLARTTLYA